VEAKGAVPRARVEAAVSLQCSGEERESPGMGGEGVVTAKRGKGSSSCWTPYSARFSLILGMRPWIQQLPETVLVKLVKAVPSVILLAPSGYGYGVRLTIVGAAMALFHDNFAITIHHMYLCLLIYGFKVLCKTVICVYWCCTKLVCICRVLIFRWRDKSS
jgi:hypothetical protein